MTAGSAEESSLSSKRSWNLKAALSLICLNADGAESALGPIKAARLAASVIVHFRFPGEGGQRPVVAQREPDGHFLRSADETFEPDSANRRHRAVASRRNYALSRAQKLPVLVIDRGGYSRPAREWSMLNAARCRILAREYKNRAREPSVTNDSAFIMNNIARSLMGLATQLDILAAKKRDERTEEAPPAKTRAR